MAVKNDKIIIALLENPTITAASKASGISEATIYRRLAEPDFKKAYDARRRQVVEVACGALQNRLSEAVDALSDIMNDGKASKMARAQAARTVLEYGIKTLETLDILPRLEALQEAAEKENGF